MVVSFANGRSYSTWQGQPAVPALWDMPADAECEGDDAISKLTLTLTPAPGSDGGDDSSPSSSVPDAASKFSLSFAFVQANGAWALTGAALKEQAQRELNYVLFADDANSIVSASYAHQFSCKKGGLLSMELAGNAGGVLGHVLLSNFTFYAAGPCGTGDHPPKAASKCTSPTMCAANSVLAYDCSGDSNGNNDWSGRSDADKEAGSAGVGLFMFFIIAFMLYCVIGISVKRFINKAEGIDQLPNSSFWVGLASGCGKGLSFLRNGCKRDAGGSGGWQMGSSTPPPYDW